MMPKRRRGTGDASLDKRKAVVVFSIDAISQAPRRGRLPNASVPLGQSASVPAMRISPDMTLHKRGACPVT